MHDAKNVNNPDHACRPMVASHNAAGTRLNIGGGTFDKFVGIIATQLHPLVKPTATKVGEITMDEFAALAAALNGQKGDVTTPHAPDGGPYTSPQ